MKFFIWFFCFIKFLSPCFPQKTGNNIIGGNPAQIPILCYHNVKDKIGKDISYFITPEKFESQIKALKNEGYVSVLPKDIYQHLTNKKPLPLKSVMFSFDDTRTEHFHIVAPILEKYGFKGTFFIMTVAIGKNNYMTKKEIRALADKGHCIGHHTWDHQDLRKLPLSEWTKQIDKPKIQLEAITGKDVSALAYPFGLCNDFAVQELKKRGLKMAFQLSGKRDQKEPLYTIRRILVPGNWSGKKLLKQISVSFQ